MSEVPSEPVVLNLPPGGVGGAAPRVAAGAIDEENGASGGSGGGDEFLRLDHGLSASRPIAVKHDVWDAAGPGMQDMHYEVELGIVLRGEMVHRNGEWEGTFGPGDVWLTGVWEPHAAVVTGVPLEVVMFHVYPPMLAEWRFPELPGRNWLAFFNAPPEERPQNLAAREAVWRDIAADMMALPAGDGENVLSVFDRLLMRPILLRFLTELGRDWPGFAEASMPDRASYTAVSRAIAAVFEQPRRMSVQEGAKLAGMNRNTFTQKFQELMGMSFAEFSLKHRLFLASHALRETDLPLKELAEQLGFTDKSHLHRSFVKLFGQTPRQYRVEAGG